MPHTTARIATANGSKYMQQLCKHWSHKFETEADATHGRVNFEVAAAHFTADADGLTATIAAPDEATLVRLQPVVASHLQRFAFRETLAVEWTGPAEWSGAVEWSNVHPAAQA
jgi:uncharacterized protein